MKNLAAIVAAAVTPRDMQARLDVQEPGWTFWERRTLNLHQVVGLSRSAPSYPNVRCLDAALRGTFSRNVRRAWWRGIGYGAVVNAGALRAATNDLKVLVDAREKSRGTMQWVVLVSADGQTVTGVHTWIEGFLSPVYRTILAALAGQGCHVSSVMKGKDGLMRVFTALADDRRPNHRSRAATDAPWRTGHRAFPEFRDPFRTDDK